MRGLLLTISKSSELFVYLFPDEMLKTLNLGKLLTKIDYTNISYCVNTKQSPICRAVCCKYATRPVVSLWCKWALSESPRAGLSQSRPCGKGWSRIWHDSARCWTTLTWAACSWRARSSLWEKSWRSWRRAMRRYTP